MMYNKPLIRIKPFLFLFLFMGCSVKEGCTDMNACNYNSAAEKDDNNCYYCFNDNCTDFLSEYYDCEGCINDTDYDGICDEIEITGCTEPTACNYNELATDDDGYCGTLITDPPPNATILSNDSCLAERDIDALADLIDMNELEEDSPLHVGIQTWIEGRLRILVANMNPGQYPAAIETPIDTLPESFGNLDDLRVLYLEWNNISYLPASFNKMENLQSLHISNNGLKALIPDFGSLNQLYLLDLGYNELTSLPDSFTSLTTLSYLWLFNNSLTSLPDGFCGLELQWSENDNNWLPYFAIGGNQLCENVPDCLIDSDNFEISLEQFYYSFPIEALQDCDGL